MGTDVIPRLFNVVVSLTEPKGNRGWWLYPKQLGFSPGDLHWDCGPGHFLFQSKNSSSNLQCHDAYSLRLTKVIYICIAFCSLKIALMCILFFDFTRMLESKQGCEVLFSIQYEDIRSDPLSHWTKVTDNCLCIQNWAHIFIFQTQNSFPQNATHIFSHFIWT